MTTISKKQGFLAASAIAAIAGVALSIPNAVSAANLATYDFEYKFADTTSANGYITVDKDNTSSSFSNPAPYEYKYSEWTQDKWVDFSFAYFGKTYTKADVTQGYFATYDFPSSSYYYPDYGSFHGNISAILSDGKPLYGAIYSDSYSPYNYGYFGYSYFDSYYNYSYNSTSLFSFTERKAVPVPAFALGIMAAGGWIASKQLRRQTKVAKQEVAA